MKLNRKLIWLIPTLILFILAGLAVRNILLRVQEVRQLPPEMITSVERGDLEIWVTGNGTVQTALEEEIRTRMTGLIETYLLEESLDVAAGDKLVTLRLQDLSLQIEMAEIDILIKEEELASLKEQIPADQANHQLSLKELQLKQARLELEELKQRQQKNREDSVIYAPISGTVVLPETGRYGVGMDVPAGTVLATLVDYDKLQVVIPVDELDISRVKEGQAVNLAAEALPGRLITGVVVQVASRGRNQGGVATFDVAIEISPMEGLKVGMNVSAAILVDVRAATLLVPIEAVFELDGEETVISLESDPGTGDNTLKPVQVTTGMHDSSFIEILAGVAEGQQIVIQGSTSWFGRQDSGWDPFPGGMRR